MMRPAGEAVAEQSNFKIRAANETATASATATAVLWKDLNGNGYDKEDGLKNGHNGNSKDHLKSGPQWSEGLGAPHLRRSALLLWLSRAGTDDPSESIPTGREAEDGTQAHQAALD